MPDPVTTCGQATSCFDLSCKVATGKNIADLAALPFLVWRLAAAPPTLLLKFPSTFQLSSSFINPTDSAPPYNTLPSSLINSTDSRTSLQYSAQHVDRRTRTSYYIRACLHWNLDRRCRVQAPL